MQREHQLVFGKEPEAGLVVDVLRQLILDVFDSVFAYVVFLALLHTCLENISEGAKRELLHVVDSRQRVDREVEHAAPLGRLDVGESLLLDFCLCAYGHFQPLLDHDAPGLSFF